MDKYCCNWKSCSRNPDNEGSSSGKSTLSEVINKGTQMSSTVLSDKETQMSLDSDISSITLEQNIMPVTSEYEVFYDCTKDKHKHRKYREKTEIDMSEVYQHMDNSHIFRGTLMQLTQLTQQLFHYFEQRLPQVPSNSKGKLENKNNLKSRLVTSKHRKHVTKPTVCSIERKAKEDPGSEASYSSEDFYLNIPLEIKLKRFSKKSKHRCTCPIHAATTKAVKSYLNKAKIHSIEPIFSLGSSSTDIVGVTYGENNKNDPSLKHSHCKSMDDQEQMVSDLRIICHRQSKYTQTTADPLVQGGNMSNLLLVKQPKDLELLYNYQSTNYKMTCIPSLEDDHVPPCWCSVKNAAEINQDFVCECGAKPDNCIRDELKDIKEQNPNEIISKLLEFTKEEETIFPAPPPLAPAILKDIKEQNPNEMIPKLVELNKEEETIFPPPPPLAPAIATNCDEELNPKLCNCGHENLTKKELEELTTNPTPFISEDNLKCSCDLTKPAPPLKPARKIYHLAIPQHKDLDTCIKCRFEPSPLIDQAGQVFCPGNCGCCMCPWKPHATYSLEDMLRHTKIKVCKCRDRLTIFTDITKTDSACSQTSYFDVCPCREKADAKHIELYGFGMSKQILRGEEVLLRDVKEMVTAKKETPEKSSETHFNRNNQNINSHQNKSSPSNTSQTSQLESTLDAKVFNNLSMAAHCPHLCTNCLQIPLHIHQTTSSSSFSVTSEDQCTCQKSDSTSSSASTISELFPIELKVNVKQLGKMLQPNLKQHPQEAQAYQQQKPRPERLRPQPYINYTSQQIPTTNFDSNTDDYYSCASEEESESDSNSSAEEISSTMPKNPKTAERNLIILQLLHQVVHLINEENPIREEALRLIKLDPPSPDLMQTNMNQQPLQQTALNQYVISKTQSGIPAAQSQPLAFPRGNNSKQTFSNFSHSTVKAPQSFVYHETEENYDELLCDGEEQITKPKTEQQMDPGIHMYAEDQQENPGSLASKPTAFRDGLRCICPKLTDICPIHGPIENILKLPSPSCTSFEDGKTCELGDEAVKEEQPLCVYANEEEKCPLHCTVNELNDFYVNYVPSPDGILPHDNEELFWKGLPIAEQVTTTKSHSSDVDVQVHPNDVEKTQLSKKPSAVVEDGVNDTTVYNKLSQVVKVEKQIEKSPYLVGTSAITGENIYNFLPELDRGVDDETEYNEELDRYGHGEAVANDEESYYPNYECEEFDEDCELAKEIRTESHQKKKHNKDDDGKRVPTKWEKNKNNVTTLATIQQLEGEGSPEELKFFIDSLILDLDAMEHARRKITVEKNLYVPRPTMCPRESFPVTITDVTDLGSTSLYVKWIIHDCYGIGGYEIYTDGYLTNRYFHCKHQAAVVTNVDITLPHKIALMAQPLAEDDSIELMCNHLKNKNNCKALPWKPDLEKEKKSHFAKTSSLWTPSIYLYDPATCKAAIAAPTIMRDSI